jgi:hypothetical protein
MGGGNTYNLYGNNTDAPYFKHNSMTTHKFQLDKKVPDMLSWYFH